LINFALKYRPKKLDGIIGQNHLLGENAVLQKLIETENLSHTFFYGPPGCGKTTLARIIASELDRPFYEMNATSLKIEDLRKIFKEYHNALQKPLIFIDEVHRLSKNQQEVLLPFMENNAALIIGASTENPYYSHLLRWENTAHIKNIYLPRIKKHFHLETQLSKLDEYCSPDIMKWHPLNRAQYIEALLFLNGYLLSSQGDRMMMGNAVEGRFPFLDHRLIEFTARINPELKIRGLNEKYILKKAFSSMIPGKIAKRPKQPYRAPITEVFLGNRQDNLLEDLLSPEYIKKYGYLNPKAMERLKKKISRTREKTTARDEMALVAAGSTQLLHYHFLEVFDSHEFRLPERQKLVDLTAQNP